MKDYDVEPFILLLDEVMGLWPNAKEPTAGQKTMFFRALADFTIFQVRSGFDAHVKDPTRGKFPPLPADIIAQIEARSVEDGRPGPEEAWAIARQASDENVTIVWTEEIAQAWGIALPVLNSGDDVGARMAFKEAYARILTEARRAARPTAWAATLGHDPAQREVAIAKAEAAGLLPKPEPMPNAKQIDGPKQTGRPKKWAAPSEIAERLKAFAAKSQNADGLAWARDLREREKSGNGTALTEAQRLAWREGLDTAPTGQQAGVFTPIADHLLPPGMRKKQGAPLDAYPFGDEP